MTGLKVVTSASIDGAFIIQFEKDGKPLSTKNPVTPSEIRELIDMVEKPTVRRLIIVVGMPLPLVTGVAIKVASQNNAVGVYMNKEQKVIIVHSKISTHILGDVYDFRL